MSGLSSTLSASSSVAGFASSWADAQSSKAQGDYQNEMSKINARYAELKADSAVKRGDREAESVKKDTKRLVGSQRAALAAQGIDIGSGSALETQEDTAMIGELEALKIKNNAWMEAFGYKMEAQNDIRSGALAKRAGQNVANTTIATGGWKAISGGLDSFSKSNFYQSTLTKSTKEKK